MTMLKPTPALQPSLTMTLAEALQAAMAFEDTAHRFYRVLAEQVHPEMRPLVLELASEEQHHHRLLAELAADPALEDHLGSLIETPPSDTGFADYIPLPDLPAEPVEDDILAYAEAREQIAREHYGYLAELAPHGPLRDLFRFLYQEEQRHADNVARRWTTLFSIL